MTLFFAALISGQILVTPPPPADETILKYEQALRDSEEKHRAYLQTLESGAAAVVVLFTAYLGWLNWKTRKELVAEIEAEYRTAAEKAAQKYGSEALRALEQHIHDLDLRLATSTSEMSPFPRLDRPQLSDRAVAYPTSSPTAAKADVTGATSTKTIHILWVDDHPRNNDQERELIEYRWAAKIDSALSTEEALAKLSRESYDLIIEDMARQKKDRAGIDFLKTLAQMRGRVPPIVVYCSTKMVTRFGAEARSLGAISVTSSPTSLMDALQSVFGNARPLPEPAPPSDIIAP
jgi:CheY-like chemotaxis protein